MTGITNKMKNATQLLASFFILICLSLAALSVQAEPQLNSVQKPSLAESLTALFWGRPHLADKLGDQNYAPFKVRRLKKAKLVFLNLKLLREMGFDIPAEGLTPELEQMVLDRLAFAVPLAGADPSLYGEETKDVYADYYGGYGTGSNGNQGSGRAASSGGVQTKGIGPTSLVSKQLRQDHVDGKLALHSALIEAIWGEILERELPHGANRVIAIIDAGDGRALMVRQDPFRPAHFFLNKNVEPAMEKSRVGRLLDRLATLLPRSRNKAVDGLQPRLFELTDRLAEEYAAMFPRKYYHGALSPGNMLMNGGTIDLSTFTAQAGFSEIHMLGEDQTAGRGELEQMKKIVLTGFVREITRYASAKTKAEAPTAEQLCARFDITYEKALKQEMTALAGFPRELIRQLSSSAEAEALSDSILKLAKAGSKIQHVDSFDRTKVQGTYDLEKILPIAAQSLGQSAAALDTALLTAIPIASDRQSFVHAYKAYEPLMLNEAKTHNLPLVGFKTGVRLTSELLTAPQLPLLGHHIEAKALEVTEQYLKGDDHVIEDWILKRSQLGVRTFKNAPLGTFVLAERTSAKTNETEQLIYNAFNEHYELLSQGLHRPASSPSCRALLR